MPDADKLRFLTGKYEDLANKAVTRGQVYFAIDGDNGKIVFDAPISSSTTKRIIMSDSVDFANKANSDSAGNIFISKYPYSFTTSSTGTSFQINIKAQNGDSISGDPVIIPIADATHAGIITNAAQDITGVKTFKTGITIDKSSGFLYSGIQSASSNSTRPVWFAYEGVNGKPVYNNNFTYNPSTEILTVKKLAGTSSYTDAVNGLPSPGDNEFTRVWFSYGISSNAENEKKRAYDDTYKYNAGTHTLNVTQYQIDNHGLIKYDATTESIVFSFI